MTGDKYIEWAQWTTGLELEASRLGVGMTLGEIYQKVKDEITGHLEEIGAEYHPDRMRVAIHIQHPVLIEN